MLLKTAKEFLKELSPSRGAGPQVCHSLEQVADLEGRSGIVLLQIRIVLPLVSSIFYLIYRQRIIYEFGS